MTNRGTAQVGLQLAVVLNIVRAVSEVEAAVLADSAVDTSVAAAQAEDGKSRIE